MKSPSEKILLIGYSKGTSRLGTTPCDKSEPPDSNKRTIGHHRSVTKGPSLALAPTPSVEGTSCHRDAFTTTQPLLYPPGKREPAYLSGGFSSTYLRCLSVGPILGYLKRVTPALLWQPGVSERKPL
ncbi:hypothetical protein AVEN_31216-1 [Araneus ventricosus]|uniref:Uncharacterized protein n=1 Tax=Araneus ventricosus TaxID=182803 RepID=A0A4Y2DCP7_ARAVE|nr:hypothetical protein AVEN_31216-1 [Araneus ventricosus]